MVKLKRTKQHMPSFVSDALKEHDLEQVYKDRPSYQGNDYLWWVNDAKHNATKQRCLSKMLNELGQGHGYMGMKWNSY